MAIIAFGACCLGILIGILVAWYIWETAKLTLNVLVSAIAIFAGSGVLAIFRFLGGADPDPNYWWYPVGLLIGFMCTILVRKRLDDDAV